MSGGQFNVRDYGYSQSKLKVPIDDPQGALMAL
jgi:hypothetical protein